MAEKTDLSKYSLDKDLPDKYWSTYLKKYEKQYKTIFCDDGIWYIQCQRGKIGMYSILKGLMSFTAVCNTKKQKTYFLQKLCLKLFNNFNITQEADMRFSIKFLETDLNLFENVLKPVKKMKLTPEERTRRSENMIKIRSEQLK